VSKVERCYRCGKRYRGTESHLDTWNVEYIMGILIGRVCPDCQSPEENAEAEIDMVLEDHSGAEEIIFDPADDDELRQITRRLMESYKTPEALRHAANRLEAACQRDDAKLMVLIARHVARHMDRVIEERR